MPYPVAIPANAPINPPSNMPVWPFTSDAAIPYRNSTLSEPSLSTARPTIRNRAEHSLRPSRISVPIELALAASALPCDDIQMLCHASINTAMPRTMALNNSCPMPSASLPITSVEAATNAEPIKPTTTPAASQRLLPLIVSVAAARMPIISAASSTSLKMMMAVPNMSASPIGQ